MGIMDMGPLGNPQDEVALLKRAGGRVAVVSPDDAALQAIGPNVLDPTHRAASAQAGRRQGRAIADTLRPTWLGK